MGILLSFHDTIQFALSLCLLVRTSWGGFVGLWPLLASLFLGLHGMW